MFVFFGETLFVHGACTINKEITMRTSLFFPSQYGKVVAATIFVLTEQLFSRYMTSSLQVKYLNLYLGAEGLVGDKQLGPVPHLVALQPRHSQV